MPHLHPEPEPTSEGMLDVGDGHAISWQTFGNPRGKPAVILHGGPGAAPWRGARTWFDPDRWRIVAFDQRMAGRSTPSAADPMRPLLDNTTHHLVSDIERLRMHLGVDRWLVVGGHMGGDSMLDPALAAVERFASRR